MLQIYIGIRAIQFDYLEHLVGRLVHISNLYISLSFCFFSYAVNAQEQCRSLKKLMDNFINLTSNLTFHFHAQVTQLNVPIDFEP